MAQKRMFDKRITDSDKFMDLPNSSKALYFMAGMEADDRGFFQPRRLQKLNGFTDDDFKVLIAKRYLIPFESGVMVITDWNKNNYLDKNRITETEYVDELNMLKLINEKYELNECLTDVKPMFNQYSIEENSIEENNINTSPKGDKKITPKEEKHKYGTYQHVLLTDKQYEQLKKDYSNYEKLIQELDEGIELKGYKYKNHYLAIRKWAERDNSNNSSTPYKKFEYNEAAIEERNRRVAERIQAQEQADKLMQPQYDKVSIERLNSMTKNIF